MLTKNAVAVVLFVAVAFVALWNLSHSQGITEISDTAAKAENAPISLPQLTTSQSALDPAGSEEGGHGATSEAPRRPLLNGVLLLLHGGRWGEKYLLRHNLPRLEQYFLACFPYPVIIFHERLGEVQQARVRALIPSADSGRGPHFQDVSPLWEKLPHGITEQQLRRWMSAGDQRKFQGRGYRLMCRFWHGLVWNMPVLDRFEYYWRLDTDAYISRPVVIDPFRLMRERSCEYGFNRLKGDAPGAVVQLWETYLQWAAQEPLVAPAALAFVKNFSLGIEDGRLVYTRPMFYNNFELGTVRLKRDPVYQSYFRFVDEREPFGILRYRWGDAPLHTLGVLTVLQGRKMCNITQADVGYRHAVQRPPPIDELRCIAS